MSFEWLNQLKRRMAKPPDYAEKTLAAYRLGMRARGSIAGVSILVDEDSCPAARGLAPDPVYHPDNAPRLPLPECAHPERCPCVYRPVMSYEAGAGPPPGEAELDAGP
jgi:hypothetical protein